ncbi:helix-turn-helix domain-containing protein [Brachybacterium sp. UMB0905]|uniref:helix-turn-helix domain-containing protein n=1 Tax=Brachybacterium sp. UMB0905 TaxID=2069310 RepID=UPI0011AEF1CE|nr:helix-turn-helix domain-containing protein [Brachybacterium sp. UMB0905]
MPAGRRLLGAHVKGYAAAYFENLADYRGAEAHARDLAARGHHQAARDLTDALADLREAARQHRSARGIPEPIPIPTEETSPHGPTVTTATAARHLGVTDRRVRYLIADGTLAATRDGTGPWRIPSTALADYTTRRTA